VYNVLGRDAPALHTILAKSPVDHSGQSDIAQ
jgi:hypothetical protein